VEVPVDAADAAILDGAKLTVPQPPLPPDEEVPVAVWRDGPVGAILSIWHDPGDDEDPFAQDITVFEFVDGAWRWRSKGGSNWPVDYGERPGIDRPMFTGTGSGAPSPDGSSSVWLVSGIAPPGVGRVQVQLPGFQTEADVEPVTSAFLVALPEWPPDSSAISAVPP
jgi:hypothetical protein